MEHARVTYTKDVQALEKTLPGTLKTVFSGARTVAIKVHMGEPGNQYHITAEAIRRIAAACRSAGLEPFVFDSPVVYNSPRNEPATYLKAVAAHGFTEASIGCPVRVSNESVPFRSRTMEYRVCKDLLDADAVLVVSHVKGHICTGLGGAIKNLGMGAVAKETKGAIHDGGKPLYVGGCTLCGECARRCPNDHIRYDDTRPRFDKSWCCGCSNCHIFCPVGAIMPKRAVFDRLLVEAAGFAAKNFRRVFYINIIEGVAKYCDCVADAGPLISEDVGIVCGADLCAVEKASFDLVVERNGKDVFEEAHHKSPAYHIGIAEEHGLGSTHYELVR
ncbi:DUF362 domain-containing protein [Candidatus Woesearchaeota archaeon]|nr:DUF362 domain-containing protein [Candidatus Woesearchaeota archaeon]